MRSRAALFVPVAAVGRPSVEAVITRHRRNRPCDNDHPRRHVRGKPGGSIMTLPGLEAEVTRDVNRRAALTGTEHEPLYSSAGALPTQDLP
jgi:hypothetical protein